MDEQNRYRATGGLFLLAVAVICLPMVFDGRGRAPLDIGPDLVAPVSREPVDRLDTLAPESDFIDRVGEFRREVDDAGFYIEGGSLVGEPILEEPDEETQVWAVQVASFRDEDNAQQMRTRLRSLGYEAFITKLKSGDEILNRVAVGPLLSEQDAERMQRELTLEVEQEARLMAFSN